LLKLNCDKALFHLRWKPTLQYDELIHFTAEWYRNWDAAQVNMYDFTMQQLQLYQEIASKREQVWIK